jgi:putative ABC transport system permease protein
VVNLSIIIKFVLKSIKEKKFRTFLILLSVALSAALFFASNAISGTMEQMYTQRMRKYFGNADIIVQANEKSPSTFFHSASAEPYRNRMEYLIGTVESVGYYKNLKETVSIDLKGYDLNDLRKMNSFLLEQKLDLMPFGGKKIIISRLTADKFHFKLGDHLEIDVGEIKHRFIVSGIAQPVGLFQEDGRSNTAVVPREVLANLFDAGGKVSCVYIKLKDPAKVNENIEVLSKVFRRYTVREPISKQELMQDVSRVTTPFMLMVTLVLFMSIFIIYTSFKVITNERLPVIGTFRSIGATKGTTSLVLFAESIIYGIIGGFFGCWLGLGILYIMSILMTPPWMTGVKTAIRFTPVQLGIAFLLAVLLAFVSSLIPIIKTSRIPVKNIVLNSIEKPSRRKPYRLILGIVFLMVAIGAPFLAPKQLAFLIAIIAMLLSVIAVVMVVPFITTVFTRVFEKIFHYIFGNEGILAAKNLRDNKSILNNISLLAIGISSLLMINTVSYSVGKEVINFYREANFEIWMWSGQADRGFERRLRTVNGVKDVYGLYGIHNVELEGRKDRIMWLQGANKNKYFNYWNINISGNSRVILDKFDEGRNILFSEMLKEKFSLKVGDLITLRLKKGKKTYQVIGFFNSIMQNGNFALIPERYFKSDTMERYYGEIFVKTSKDPAGVAGEIKQKFQRNRPFVMTMRDMEAGNMKSNEDMFLILKGFSILALVIGIFGVFNNLLISFMERKRSLAILRSIGMSKSQTLKIIFIESATGGLIGGTVGVLAGIVIISIVPNIMKALDIPIKIHYSFLQMFLSLAGGIFITVMASISPAFKSSKLNIIEAIKYE